MNELSTCSVNLTEKWISVIRPNWVSGPLASYCQSQTAQVTTASSGHLVMDPVPRPPGFVAAELGSGVCVRGRLGPCTFSFLEFCKNS